MYGSYNQIVGNIIVSKITLPGHYYVSSLGKSWALVSVPLDLGEELLPAAHPDLPIAVDRLVREINAVFRHLRAPLYENTSTYWAFNS